MKNAYTLGPKVYEYDLLWAIWIPTDRKILGSKVLFRFFKGLLSQPTEFGTRDFLGCPVLKDYSAFKDSMSRKRAYVPYVIVLGMKTGFHQGCTRLHYACIKALFRNIHVVGFPEMLTEARIGRRHVHPAGDHHNGPRLCSIPAPLWP